MAIRQKRSLTPGSIPTTSSLQAGELAINVPDGRLFLRKSGSGSDTIQSAITTGAQNSGSVVLSGSLSIYNPTGNALEISGDIFEISGDLIEFTGSFKITGSATVTGSLSVTNGITGSLQGTSSWAVSASQAITASYVLQAVSASFATTAAFASNANLLDGLDSTVFATTGSNTFVGNQVVTGSVVLSGSAGVELTVLGDQVNTGSLTVRSGSVTINTGSLIINSGSITVNTNGDSRVFASTFRPVGASGFNIYIGHAGTTNTFSIGNDGSFNTSIGAAALVNNTRGNLNTAVGYAAGTLITTGIQNTAIGGISLNGIATGNYNTAVGYAALQVMEGSRNIAIGSGAASTMAGYITSSIYIGYNTVGANPTFLSNTNNEIVIGDSAVGNGDNSVTLGNTNVTKTILRGKVGIGTTSPVNVLDVVGNVSASWYTGSLFGTASFAVSASWAPGGGGGGISFPYTGSAVITGSLVVTGSFDLGIAEFNSTSSATTAGTTIVSSYATASANSAFYNYYISSGSNARAGQIMSVWSGSTINYTEVTTNDIGNTNTASFAVTLATGNVRLSFTAPGVWTVRSIVNLL
jgi:hypothetical protein